MTLSVYVFGGRYVCVQALSADGLLDMSLPDGQHQRAYDELGHLRRTQAELKHLSVSARTPAPASACCR